MFLKNLFANFFFYSGYYGEKTFVLILRYGIYLHIKFKTNKGQRLANIQAQVSNIINSTSAPAELKSKLTGVKVIKRNDNEG